MKTKLGKVTAEDGTEIELILSGPDGSEPTDLTQDDVWGSVDYETLKRTSRGMIVARGVGPVSTYFTQEQKDELTAEIPEVCPIWGDTLPYKSVTVVCRLDQEDAVRYWLAFVHGSGDISKRWTLPGNRLALRSDYMCW